MLRYRSAPAAQVTDSDFDHQSRGIEPPTTWRPFVMRRSPLRLRLRDLEVSFAVFYGAIALCHNQSRAAMPSPTPLGPLWHCRTFISSAHSYLTHQVTSQIATAHSPSTYSSLTLLCEPTVSSKIGNTGATSPWPSFSLYGTSLSVAQSQFQSVDGFYSSTIDM